MYNNYGRFCPIYTPSQFFVVTLSGCRHGFEPIPTRKAEFHAQAAMAEKGGGAKTISTDIIYDPQLANGGGVGATSGNGRKLERERVGKNGGNGSSAQARDSERLPLAPQPLKSSTRARQVEGGEMCSVQQASGGESRAERRRITFMRECLLPFNILQEKRVHTVLFVYALFAVRNSCFAACNILYLVLL